MTNIGVIKTFYGIIIVHEPVKNHQNLSLLTSRNLFYLKHWYD